MADHEFLFALKLPDDGRFGGMLSDLTSSVLRHAGYAAAVIDEIGRELQAGVARRLADGECDVQFLAHAGELEITVSQGGHRLFRTSRPLPD